MISKFISSMLRPRPTRREKAQGLMEFVLITPLLLLVILGTIEFGRMLAIYSMVSSGAKQAARYGSVAGEVSSGLPFYLDCRGMRDEVYSATPLQSLDPSDITIRYERGTITGTYQLGWCPPLAISPTLPGSAQIVNGDRVVISVTTVFEPLVPIVPLPEMPITFAAARTIFTTILGSTATPRPDPDLRIAKSGRPLVVSPGGDLTYVITVTNPSTSTIAQDITISDTIPLSPLRIRSYSSTSGITCLPAVGLINQGTGSTQINCTRLPPLAPGQSISFTMVVTTPLFGNVIMTNTASVTNTKTDLNPIDNTVTITNQVLPGADLEILKTASAEVVGSGTRMTYTLIAQNNGGQNASANNSNRIWMTDTLPVGAQYAGLVSSGSWNSCNLLAGSPLRVECSRSSPLDVGTATLPVRIIITAPASTGLITNVAVLSASPTTPDPLLHNNIVTVTTQVSGDTDMQITKLGASAANSGANFNYVLTVRNNGPAIGVGVVMTDFLPAGVTFVSATGAGWVCPYDGDTNEVHCSHAATMQPNTAAGDVTITVQAPVADVVLSNSATVSSVANDPTPGNNTVSGVQTTVTDCQLGVVNAANSLVSASPTSVFADNTSTATVLVTLRDRCSNLVTTSQNVTLISSRGGSDTISLAPGHNNPTSTGQVGFLVRSGIPGTSTYSVAGVTQTANVLFYSCADLAAVPVAGGGTQQSVAYDVNNTSGMPRRLTGVTLNWASGGSRRFTGLVIQGVTVWSGSSHDDPFSIPGNGTFIDGTDAARTIANNPPNPLPRLVLSFDFNVISSPPVNNFNLTTTWDDSAGGNICTHNISVTR